MRDSNGQFMKTLADEEIIEILKHQNEKVTTEYIRSSTELESRGSLLMRLKDMRQRGLIQGELKGHTWLWWVKR